MQTRSQKQKVHFDVIINFEEASEEWKANKKYVGNGSYKYICLQKTQSGKPCKREAQAACDYCKIHKKYIHV